MGIARSLLIVQLFVACSSSGTIKYFSELNPAKDYCKGIKRFRGPRIRDQLSQLIPADSNKTGVKILETGSESIATRAWLSSSAGHTIDVQYFIFSVDNVGLIALDYLVRAADRGIKVRILVDDFMLDAEEDFILEMASHPNIDIKIYNPSANIGKNIVDKVGSVISDFRGFNQRMHNKTFIVDGSAVITGGRNIADEYFDYNREYNFRDRDVLILGQGVQDIQRSFNLYWNDKLSVSIERLINPLDYDLSPKRTFENLKQYACEPSNYWPSIRSRVMSYSNNAAINLKKDLVWVDAFYFVSDIPGKNDRNRGLKGSSITTNKLLNLIKEAKYSVDIQSPYLVTTKLSERAFKEASARGVKIRILTNSLASTDGIEAFSGYQRSRANLLKMGLEIYEYRPDAAIRFKIMRNALQKEIEYKPIFGLHAKSMVIDGKKLAIGTYNIDPRSAHLNTECFVLIDSVKLSKNLLKTMEEELQSENSWKITADFNPDSEAGWWKRFKAWTRWLIPKSIL